MKKIILLLMLSAVVLSCKNSEEKNEDATEVTTETVEKLTAYKGDFIDSNGAMVLMGNNFIYGVKRNLLSEELSKQVAGVTKSDLDMVSVIVRGSVSKNTENDSEWEEILTITEIMRVADKPSEEVIKLNETAKKN
ncbi:hypothetical protein [Aequorivita lipolytica]|uniref:NlpE C-terminal OB domain-containing protein n=1 Tax=Aequorivita lipolytica TaxID=153267 RepID=A0A5C6YSP5_9FLAO|nr:hypothetical protein [Aequorivita lipolytica]TXD70072.1 hypothetical protein ESV24_02570 [Aequorivita lipolytica]SRX50482.1 hypothetical protein AEQU2_00955 [Aequorivita lipolytica]